MGTKRKTADAIKGILNRLKPEKPGKKPESKETEEVDGMTEIQRKTRHGVYRVNATRQREREDAEIIAETSEKLERSYDEMCRALETFGFIDSDYILSPADTLSEKFFAMFDTPPSRKQNTPPSRTEFMESVRRLDPAMLATIARFGKPSVLIIPKAGFKDMVQAIDDHKRLPKQRDTRCLPSRDDHYWRGGGSEKMVVSVVDGLQAMPQPSFIIDDSNVRRKMDKYEEEFAKRGLDMMDCREGAMLMMKSLIGIAPVLLDDEDITETRTYFKRQGHIISCGFWDSQDSGFVFRAAGGADMDRRLRCRPSAKVMEI